MFDGTVQGLATLFYFIVLFKFTETKWIEKQSELELATIKKIL